jgi:hypothetical protein
MMEYVGQVDSSEPVGQSLVSATVAIFIGIAVSQDTDTRRQFT